jgi:hypothetical protein
MVTLARLSVVSVTVPLGHQALRNNSMEEGSGSAGNTKVERTHALHVDVEHIYTR